MNINNIYFNLENNITIDKAMRIFFLCGSYFQEKGDIKDKRKVLQEYLDNLEGISKSIILEKAFMFSSDKRKLNYNDMQLKSLKDIELLTSLLSDKIFLLHESISTATEIGLFSQKQELLNKMLILVPDKYSVEEDLMSGFLSLSYNNKIFKDYNIDTIRYFPTTRPYLSSNNNHKLHSYFFNDLIGENFKEIINSYLPSTSLNIKSLRKRNHFDNDRNTFFKEDGKVNISITPETFRALYLSLFSLSKIRELVGEEQDIPNYDFRSSRDRLNVLYKGVKILKEYFKKFLVNTLRESFLVDIGISELTITVHGCEVPFDRCFDYFLYLLFAMNLLKVNTGSNKRPFISISTELVQISTNYNLLIKEKSFSLSEVLADE